MNRLAWLVLVICLPASLIAQDKNGICLKKRVGSLKMTSQNSFQILGELSSSYEVRMSIEVSPNDANYEKNSETYEVNDGTIKDVLDSFVKLHPHYQWVVIDGTITISPTAFADRENILDIKLPSLLIENENIGAISYKIINHVEVLRFLKTLGIRPNNDSSAFGNFVERPVFSFDLKNQTVKQVLNYMLQNKIIRYWSIYRNKGSDNYVRLIVR